MCVFLLFLIAGLFIAAAAVFDLTGNTGAAVACFRAGSVTWLAIMALGGWGWLRGKKGGSNESDTPY